MRNPNRSDLPEPDFLGIGTRASNGMGPPARADYFRMLRHSFPMPYDESHNVVRRRKAAGCILTEACGAEVAVPAGGVHETIDLVVLQPRMLRMRCGRANAAITRCSSKTIHWH